jgi:hypothetical protein
VIIVPVECISFVSQCHTSCSHVGGSVTSTVDLYNAVTSTWTTAQLSVARYALQAAASVGNVAVFAGGYNPYLGAFCGHRGRVIASTVTYLCEHMCALHF